LRPQVQSSPSTVAQTWASFASAAQAFAAEANRCAARAQDRANEDSAHRRILDAAQHWFKSEGADDDALRFERFLTCAVPDARVRGSKDEFAVWLATQCSRVDPEIYMTRVRTECAPELGAGGDKASDDDHALLASLRHAALRGRGEAYMMFASCTGHVRKQWVAADAKPLMDDAETLFHEYEELARGIDALKPPVPEP
jgi:hypothetical protein